LRDGVQKRTVRNGEPQCVAETLDRVHVWGLPETSFQVRDCAFADARALSQHTLRQTGAKSVLV